MAMYSTQPLPPLDTLHSHEGFWLALCGVILLLAFTGLVLEAFEKLGNIVWAILIGVCLLLLVAYYSFTEGKLRYILINLLKPDLQAL